MRAVGLPDMKRNFGKPIIMEIIRVFLLTEKIFIRHHL